MVMSIGIALNRMFSKLEQCFCIKFKVAHLGNAVISLQVSQAACGKPGIIISNCSTKNVPLLWSRGNVVVFHPADLVSQLRFSSTVRQMSGNLGHIHPWVSFGHHPSHIHLWTVMISDLRRCTVVAKKTGPTE